MNRASVLIYAPVIAAGFCSPGLSGLISEGFFQVASVGLIAVAAFLLFLTLFSQPLDHRAIVLLQVGVLSSILVFISIAIADGGISHLNWGYAVKLVCQILGVTTWCVFARRAPWDLASFWFWICGIVLVVVLANLAYWVSLGFPGLFVGFAVQKNVLGIMGLFGVFLGFGAMHFREHASMVILGFGSIFLSYLLLYASTNRTLLLLSLVGVALSWTWPMFRRSRSLRSILFVSIISLIAATPFFYDILEWSGMKAVLNQISRDTTGMRLESGRNLLWPIVIREIRSSPIFGVGSRGEERFEIQEGNQGQTNEWSAHNLYLDVLYKTGIVGMVGVFIYFLAIWRMYFGTAESWVTRLSFGMFVVMFLSECFEVSLFRNNLIIGIAKWSIIASGISVAAMEDHLRRSFWAQEYHVPQPGPSHQELESFLAGDEYAGADPAV